MPRPKGCERAESPIVKELFELHHMMMRVGDRMASPHGLTSSRWMMLCAIGQADEPATINEISERANLSAQNVSRMVGSMEDDGLVCRFGLPGRGRSTFVGLTADGWDAYATTKQLAVAFCDPFLEGFSETRLDRLDRDLKKLIGNIARLEAALIADPGRGLNQPSAEPSPKPSPRPNPKISPRTSNKTNTKTKAGKKTGTSHGASA